MIYRFYYLIFITFLLPIYNKDYELLCLEISQEKCPDHKKRIDGICKCSDESLKTKDGYCCYMTYSLKNRKKINCYCPKNKVYDFVKNVCKQRVKFIFD